jgi:hypothetical protein
MHALCVKSDGALCRTYSQVGEQVAEFPTVHEPAYNSQYDVPLWQDKSRLYVPTWWQYPNRLRDPKAESKGFARRVSLEEFAAGSGA